MDKLLESFDAIDDLELLPTFRESLVEHGRLGEGAQARIAELEAEVAELTEEIKSAMAHNYKLMVAATTAAAEDVTDEKIEQTEEEVELDTLIKDVI